jgi:type VII secretion protein EccB
MATKRDLVDAQAFSRRRLVTAFVSGAPAGREVEPRKPFRAVVGGVALSALIIAGGAAAGLLSPTLPDGWNNNSLVVAKSSGARFVALQGTLYPVINTTSARLIIPANDFRVVSVPDRKIATTPRGITVGILGAPDVLPAADQLVQTGWTACTSNTGGITTVLARQPPAVTATGMAVVVRSASRTWVVTGNYRLPVPAANQAAILRALGLDTAPSIAASATWLNLFPAGPALTPLTLAGAGTPLTSRNLPPGVVVGSVLAVSSGTGSARRYVVDAAGKLAPLSAVGYALYRIGSGSSLGGDVEVSAAQTGGIATEPQPIAPTQWPETMPVALNGVACAVLHTGPNAAGITVSLGASGSVVPPASGSTTAVAAGTGAVIRVIGDGVVNRGPVQLIDQAGQSFPIPDPGTVLPQLGYRDDLVTNVPQPWAELFPGGPALTGDAARRTPAATVK